MDVKMRRMKGVRAGGLKGDKNAHTMGVESVCTMDVDTCCMRVLDLLHDGRRKRLQVARRGVLHEVRRVGIGRRQCSPDGRLLQSAPGTSEAFAQ